MAAKLHAKGRYFDFNERRIMGFEYRSHETLCGLLFKTHERDPFAKYIDGVTCQWCKKIIEKSEQTT